MADNDRLFLDFSRASRLLARGGWKRVSLLFDDAEREFELAWGKVHSEFQNRPQDAKVASAQLIEAQPLTSALALAIARTDTVELFGRFKRLLESILVKTERLSGYPAVRGIPHVQAGFLYMTTSVMALHWEAWGTLEKLLTSKFEWYYQSGRAIFSYPFEMPYFFHSEAFGRSANTIHDFFRERLSSPEFVRVTQLTGDSLLDAYTQTQMLMSLRVAQLHENGESARIWPDFGRFYGHRVVRLLDRAYTDPEFGSGVLRAFGEDRGTFFSHLNQRLSIISSIFFRGAPFLYESLGSWEPRETHA
ncbi:MAG TPA: hypothetical protein VEF05_12765 [Terriglobales bacterium]|nr:hypothetical protein [Terriglobales bacterium]